METSAGHLLGGRVAYAQPRDGYRTGIEPVLLAACVPAQSGQRVLEAGTGAGAGLLCLAARVPGVHGVGVEIDPEMAALARGNLAGVAGFAIVTGDVTEAALPPVEHAFANPPWHDPRSTASPVARRRLAKQGGGLALWVAAMARAVVPGGTVSLILPAGQSGPAGAALATAGFGRIVLLPLLPKAGRAAKLVVIQGRGGAGPAAMLAGLVLHEDDGRFTAAADRVLREGGGLLAGD